MKKILILLALSCFNIYASDYGELYIAAPIEISTHHISVSYQNEIDNKLNDINGLGISYGYRLNSYIETGISYYKYTQSENDFSKSLASNINIISAQVNDRKSIYIDLIPLIGQINLLSYSTAKIELGIGVSYGLYRYKNKSALLINNNKFYDIHLTTTIKLPKNYTTSLKLSRVTRSENSKGDTALNTLDLSIGYRF
ncbi:hypothetical protein [Halobacteriovorax sp.]|uniref:hypothetical protein n=1 Tax=Halobacteriovorax sp. TaxID=2020862 RepID=UPI003566BADA